MVTRKSFNSKTDEFSVENHSSVLQNRQLLGESKSVESLKGEKNTVHSNIDHPADYFSAESLNERMKLYAQQGGIPIDYMERYANIVKNN
jgi:hypothetical protein